MAPSLFKTEVYGFLPFGIDFSGLSIAALDSENFWASPNGSADGNTCGLTESTPCNLATIFNVINSGNQNTAKVIWLSGGLYDLKAKFDFSISTYWSISKNPNTTGEVILTPGATMGNSGPAMSLYGQDLRLSHLSFVGFRSNALEVGSSQLILDHLTVENCTGRVAIHATVADSVQLIGCTFKNNSIENDDIEGKYYGGAALMLKLTASNTQIKLSNCTFIGSFPVAPVANKFVRVTNFNVWLQEIKLWWASQPKTLQEARSPSLRISNVL